jgi:hypothetical protein
MDMVTNGAIITGALDYANGKAEKLVSQVVGKYEEEVPENQEDKTTNDVF